MDDSLVSYKVSFHTHFSGKFPAIHEALEKSMESYGEVDFADDVWTICSASDISVDENLYMEICAYLYNSITIDECRSLFLHCCSGCGKLRAAHMSIFNRSISNNCSKCRKAKPVNEIPCVTYCIRSFQSNDMAVAVSEIERMQKVNAQAAKQCAHPVHCLFELPSTCYTMKETNADGKMYFADESVILEAISSGDGYRYTANGRYPKRVAYRCSQRSKVGNPPPGSPPQRKRLRLSKRCFDCVGSVSFSLASNEIMRVNARHEFIYECEPSKPRLQSSHIQRLNELMQSGSSP